MSHSHAHPVGQSSARWQVLTVLAIAIVLSMATWFSATAVVPQLTVLWHLSPTATAWLTIGVQVGFVIGAVASSVSNLSDLISSKKLMIYGSIGASLANAAILLTDSAAIAILFRIFTGIFLALIYPSALKLIATWFIQGRGLALGILVGALTLGSALPHLVNAMGGLQWQFVITATSCATILGAGLMSLLVKEGPFPFPSATFNPRGMKQVFQHRSMVLIGLGYFGHMWELYAMWAWFLTFARMTFIEQGMETSQLASLFTFAVIGIGGLGCVLGGILGDRWGRTMTTSWMMGLSGTCAMLAGFVFDGPLWLLIGISLVWGFTIVADSAQFSTMITEVGDPRYIGTALTMQLGIGFLLTIATIWLLPLAADYWQSWQWVFLILVPGPLLGIGAMVLLRRLPEAMQIANGRR